MEMSKLERLQNTIDELKRLVELNKDRECNGWTNWETWNVGVWIDELRLIDEIKGDDSLYSLADFKRVCNDNKSLFEDFYIEDSLGNQYFDDHSWNKVKWAELFKHHPAFDED